MLTDSPDAFRVIAEVNPPELPDMGHLLLDGAWDSVLITDNVFGKIRVSPYAYAARLTHDTPSVHPTVVVSTRDRNILAIESEVRGALGNDVNSFLVVTGDTMPAVEHLAHHYEIVEHLAALKAHMPPFETGMATRFRRWQYARRLELGPDFFVAGPVLDPETVAPSLERLGRDGSHPPLYLMVAPPFSSRWVERMVGVGAVPVGNGLVERMTSVPKADRRRLAWSVALETAEAARASGCAGVIVVGLNRRTLLDEAPAVWRRSSESSPST